MIETKADPQVDAILAAAERFKSAFLRDLIDAGGQIDALDLLQTTHLLMIEIRTLRQFVIDLGAEDLQGREGLQTEFFRRLIQEVEKATEKLETPKIRLNGS